MVVKNVLHMNAGDGETSYANNSGLQKFVMSKTLPVLIATLKDMMYNNHLGFGKCFKMVDLGCSSGPNTFLATSHIINTIEELCRENNNNNINDHLPEFEVFLNDLPDNDFNNLFKLLPNSLHVQDRDDGMQRGSYYIYGLPGSFYSRLFPSNCLHFAYSSYSLHWLSQVPQGLENNNKEYIYMAMTSPREVYEAYAKQYQRDFCKFLSLRSEEIISGGRMVLTIVGRSVEDPSTKDDFPVFTLLAKTLVDVVTEGVGNMDDLYSFNMPFYAPCTQEVETAVQAEGSFTLDKVQCFHLPLHLSGNNNSDVDDDEQEDPLIFDRYKRGKVVADKFIRAFMEPMLASHFGSSIIDDLFGRYADKLAEHLRTGKLDNFNIVISLSRK